MQFVSAGFILTSGSRRKHFFLAQSIATILFPVFSRCNLHDISKCCCKFTLILVSDLAGNFSDGCLCLAKQSSGLFHAIRFHIGSNGLTIDPLECIF